MVVSRLQMIGANCHKRRGVSKAKDAAAQETHMGRDITRIWGVILSVLYVVYLVVVLV